MWAKIAHNTVNPSAVSKGIGIASPKSMTLFHSISERSQWSHFWIFFFENFGKLNVKNFQGSSSLRWKMKKSKFLKFFCKKYYFFWLNLYCTCSQLYFEVYISCLAQNLKFWPFLVWKISFLTFVIWQLVAAKVYHIEGLIGVYGKPKMKIFIW